MTVLTPEPTAVAQRGDPALLIREARRRQHRRRLFASVLALATVAIAIAVAMTGASPRSSSLLARPLHYPQLAAGGRCPVSSATTYANAAFSGVALGRGPVRLLLADRGDIAAGRVDLCGGDRPGWFALQTLWIAIPSYHGPFVVRAARLGAASPIAVKPGPDGLTPGLGPLTVTAGLTPNTQDGYRTVPGSTWVKSPGCYAWQIDGRGFSEIIVADALAPIR